MTRVARCLPLVFLFASSCTFAKEPPNTSTARGVLRIPAQASVGGASIADAGLRFSCTTGKGGALEVAVILPVPEDVPAFPLDAFEGPDGIGQARALATWSMLGPRAMNVPMPLAGWRGVDGDGFLLASSHLSGTPSDLARLLRRWVEDGGQALRLSVAAPQGGASLEVRALPNDYRTRLGVALSPCFAVLHRR